MTTRETNKLLNKYTLAAMHGDIETAAGILNAHPELLGKALEIEEALAEEEDAEEQ